MTKRENAIVSAYTGFLCGSMDYLYEYFDELEGRPVFTHELPYMKEKHKERIKEDFCNLKIEESK